MPAALHHRIGQLAVVGFEGTTLPPDLRALAREFDLGGIILFARNVESPGQVADVACRAQELASDLPLWVAVDQEGGRVARLKRPFTEWPPMITLGRAGDGALAARYARALALELAAVGVSLDFAPVLDVLTNPRNTVIGDRALSDRADVVATLGAAIVGALQGGGVAACGKHFPGHGDTSADSHRELPTVEHSPERLREVELVPFRAGISAGVTGIMIGHLLVPSLDEEQPATLSRAIVTGLLRGELGFDGVVFTDDLDMGAIAGRMSRENAAVAAVRAGCDVVLLCGTDCSAHAAACEALVHAVEREDLPYGRVEEALARQRKAKERCASGLTTPEGGAVVSPLSRRWRPASPAALRAVLGCAAHQAVAEEMVRFL